MKADIHLFLKHNNQTILLRDKFIPSKEFPDYHSKFIFKSWLHFARSEARTCRPAGGTP
jgi:hypothetical protein